MLETLKISPSWNGNLDDSSPVGHLKMERGRDIRRAACGLSRADGQRLEEEESCCTRNLRDLFRVILQVRGSSGNTTLI